MAGRITYTRAITGTIGTNTYAINDTHTGVINNGSVNDYTIAAATWTTLFDFSGGPNASNEWHLALINKGANPAVYRIKVGANYYRFNLPSGKAIHITGNGAYGGASNSPEIAVYSTIGTSIQAGFFY